MLIQIIRQDEEIVQKDKISNMKRPFIQIKRKLVNIEEEKKPGFLFLSLPPPLPLITKETTYKLLDKYKGLHSTITLSGDQTK